MVKTDTNIKVLIESVDRVGSSGVGRARKHVAVTRNHHDVGRVSTTAIKSER